MDISGILDPNVAPEIQKGIALNLQQVIIQKVAARIKRKNSNLPPSSSTDKVWREMNDMSANLIENEYKGYPNKHEIIKMQTKSPERSKSYSVELAAGKQI
jgi:hypothetical protein